MQNPREPYTNIIVQFIRSRAKYRPYAIRKILGNTPITAQASFSFLKVGIHPLENEYFSIGGFLLLKLISKMRLEL